MAENALNRGFTQLRGKKRLIAVIALTPGWIIPRIIGTIAFVSHPTWTGLLALLSWWLLIPCLWWMGFKLLRWSKGRYRQRPQ
jgi:hypothetical protein